MARRGRFTNPNAGGQNLSSLIVSLLRERKNAEEQLMLQKFRNKEVSADEMQAFYDNWASSSGYGEGTLEYDQLQQKKKDVFDTGVKYEYDALLATFNSTGGGNYSEMMDFLNGRAQTVNDGTTRQQYLDLRKNVTNNFISSAAEQLANGQMDITEFRAAINAGIDGSFEKGTKEYYDARYAAFVAEYNGEYTKFNNRIKAGKTGAYGELLSFVKQMKANMTAAGIDPKSELFGRIDADIVSVANAGRTAGSNAQIDRATAAGDILGAIYGAALATSGVPGTDLTANDIAGGKKYDLGMIASNPAAFATYIRLLESGAADISPELRAMGIDSVDDLRRVIDKQVAIVETSLAGANAVNPTEANAQWAAIGKSIGRTLGTTTQLDEISDSMNQYANDVQNAGAGGDDVALHVAATEWSKFLQGLPSKYGQIDKALLAEQISTYGTYGTSFNRALQNSMNGSKGNVLTSGDQSLEDFFGVPGGFDGKNLVSFGTLYSNGVFPEAMINYSGLTSGTKVQVITRDPVTGVVSKVTTDRTAAGPTGMLGNSQVFAKNGGYLNVITYVEGIDGSKVPVVQSIGASTTINVANGTATTPWGFKYVMSSGKEIWISTRGKAYETNPFANPTGVESNGVVFSDGVMASGVDPLDAVPAFDFNSILGTEPKDYNEIRDIVTKLEEITAPGSPFAAALGAADIAKVQGQIGVLKTKANNLEITEIETRMFRNSERGADTLADQARLKDLQNPGSVDGYNYTNFVLKNKNLYTEVSPGVYKLNPREGVAGSAGGYALLGAQRDAQGKLLPETVDIGLPQNKPQLTGPNPFTVGLGGTGFLNQGSVEDTKKVAGDIFDFFRNKPTAPTAPSYLGSNYQGGAPIAPPTVNTPTIAPALTPFNSADPEARRALIAAQTQTTAPAVPPPPRPPTTFGGR